MIGYFVRFQIINMMLAIVLGMSLPQKATALTWNMPPTEFSIGNVGVNNVGALADDTHGNAFSVWAELDQIYVSDFLANTNVYSAPISLYTGTVLNVDVAADATGTAIAVWPDYITGNLFSAHYDGTNWTTLPTPVGNIPTGEGGLPPVEISIVMDSHGNGLFVWQDSSVIPFPGSIFASFFNGTTLTWSPPVQLNTPGTVADSPQIAYSSNGTAVATWTNSSFTMLASNFNGTTWSSPVVITTFATNTQVGIDAAGNALAVWLDIPTGGIRSSYYTGTWAAPILLGFGNANSNLAFDMNLAGTGIATWIDLVNNLTYATFNAGTWTFGGIISNNLNTQNVALDSAGNALVAWANDNAILSAYRPAGGSFGPADTVTTNFTGTVFTMEVALSNNGRGFTDWGRASNETTFFEGSFTLLDILPPGSISGVACSNKFASQTDHVHIITWTGSVSASIVSYNLYRNGVLIAVVAADSSQVIVGNSIQYVYYDHHRHGRDQYTIIATDAFGNQSAPISVTVK